MKIINAICDKIERIEKKKRDGDETISTTQHGNKKKRAGKKNEERKFDTKSVLSYKSKQIFWDSHIKANDNKL